MPAERCEHCHREQIIVSRYCEYCGGVIKKKCRVCSAEISRASQFCYKCGTLATDGPSRGSIEPAASSQFARPTAGLGTTAPPSYAYEPQYEYAGFWRRFAASFINGVVLLSFCSIWALLIGRSPVLYYAGGAIMTWLYHALMESSSLQSTVGGLIMGLVVIDRDGGRLTFGRATLRHLGRLFAYSLTAISIVLFLFSKEKQMLHDMIADCLVVVK